MKKFLVLFLAAVLLVITGCKGDAVSTKENYIKASVEFICYTVQNPQLVGDEGVAMDKLKEVFKKYNFPADDEEKMNALITEFAKDNTITDAITKETDKCVAELKNLDDTAPQTDASSIAAPQTDTPSTIVPQTTDSK